MQCVVVVGAHLAGLVRATVLGAVLVDTTRVASLTAATITAVDEDLGRQVDLRPTVPLADDVEPVGQRARGPVRPTLRN